MAIASRRRRIDASPSYWPGFVDAMATLLLVIIFLLSVFMLAQFLLAREISGRDTALNQLRSQLAELTDLLALERASTRSLEASLSGLSDDLATAESERIRLAGLVGELEGANRALEAQVVVLQERAEDADEARLSALAELERQQQVVIDLRTEADRRATRIAELASDLETEREARAQADALAASRQATIVDLRSEAEKSAADLAALTASLETERASLTQATEELENQRVLVVDLRQQVDEATTRADETAARLQSESEAREQLAAALAAQENQAAQAQTRAEEAERRLLVLSDDNAEAEAALSAAYDQLAAAQERILVLQDEEQKRLRGVDAEIALLRSQADDAESQREQALAEAERQRQLIIDLRRERDTGSTELAAIGTRLRSAETARDEALNQVDLVNRQLLELRRQLASLQEALDASEARDAAQRTQIADLGRRLNVALAQRVKELSRYRSEFFGRLRQILSSRSDIQVVGDRFVFQSEVLFPPGNASLDTAGRTEMGKLAGALLELEQEIPTEINWVLRVDGHTDRRPINTFLYQSNWELSSARAISVVRYLIQQGVDPKRLVAAGFGEFQPLVDAELEDIEGLRRNRRIELKLTER